MITSSLRILSLLVILGLTSLTTVAAQPAVASQATSVLDFTLNLADGKPMPLNTFRGKVLLLVNVASKCGFTGQYAGLQRIFKKYEAQGFAVLGFPSNDFLWQEPGTNEEIVSFCTLNYGVTFPIFAKSSVKGRSKTSFIAFSPMKKLTPVFLMKFPGTSINSLSIAKARL